MGDKKFTFVELHLDGNPQFGPRTISDALPFGEKYETDTEDADTDVETATDLDTDEDTDDAAAADDDSGGKGAIGALVVLGVLVAAGVAVKKFRGDDEPELEEEEQPDVVVN